MLMDDEDPKTIFDFDLGLKADDWLEVKQLQIANLLMPGSDENLQWILEDTACRLLEKFPVFEKVVSSDDNYEFLVQYIVRFMQILKHNSSKIIRSQKVEGTTIQLFGSLLSHSCDPNVVNISVDNKFAIIVTKPIKKGHQVFVNYKATFDVQPNREKRRSKLLRDFNFLCDCDACEQDFKFMELPKIDQNFNCPLFKLPETFDSAAKEFKENCQYIKANFEAYPCLELSVLEVRNKALLALIADKAMWSQ